MTMRPGLRSSPRKPTSARLLLGRRNAVMFLALAVSGGVTSLYLTYVHYRLDLDPTWQSICAITPALNCDTVVSSVYGTLLGAPLSAYAAWFYAVTATLALAGHRSHRRMPRSPAVLLLLAGAFAGALSLVLAVVSVAWIGSLCLACVALYLVNVAILLTAWHAFRATGESLRQALSAERLHAAHHRVFAAAVVGSSLALLAMIPWAYSRPPAPRSMVCDIVADPAFRPPLTVVIYSDFQCPHCRTLDHNLRRLRGRTGLRIIPRQYPLDSACNQQVKGSRHAGACLQARAAICAGAQARYDDFTDRLFDDGPTDVDGLTRLATSLGLDRSRFEACLRSERAAEQLAADIRAGVADGVRGTPTVLVNGQRLAGSLSANDIGCINRAARGTPEKGSSRRRTHYASLWHAARQDAAARRGSATRIVNGLGD